MEDQSTVMDLTIQGHWNEQSIGELFPQDTVQHIVSNIKPPTSELGTD